MTGDERDILLAAQNRAIEILSASRAEANRIIGDAQAEAVALLLEQHERAESLIRQQQDDIANRRLTEEDARAVLERHRMAADLLASGDQEAATKLRETSGNQAVDVLMAGQREASAILLEAWMRVTEGRPPAGERSG